MAVVMFFEVPGATTGEYDKINELMGVTRPEDEPEALISHVCAVTDGGLFICDVWRSKEELNEFLASKLGPAAAETGLPPVTPRIGELHYSIGPR